jgi:hypothetical protein
MLSSAPWITAAVIGSIRCDDMVAVMTRLPR